MTKATLSFLELTRPKLLCQIHEYQSHPSISGQSNTNHKASPFDLKPLEWILNAEAGLHSLKYLVVAVLRSQKNAKFRTSVLRCWRLCRLSSKFKIHSKGCKSNGEALWLWYCLIFLSAYCFSYILRLFIFVIPNQNTLYLEFLCYSLFQLLFDCIWSKDFQNHRRI